MRHSIVSFFNAPITNKVPSCVCSLQALHGYIVNDSQLAGQTDRVRAELADAKRFRRVKQHLLPYVTPAGVFTYCREQGLLLPSGETIEASFDTAMHTAWDYLRLKYGLEIDESNADLCRACFICHDPKAKLKME